MSVNAIEKLFWELGEYPEKFKAYMKGPDAYLARFPLTDAERGMIRSMDVQALDAHGVSHMLTMPTFLRVNGGNNLLMFEYLKQMNGGKMINRMKLPGPVFSILGVVLGIQNYLVKARQRFS